VQVGAGRVAQRGDHGDELGTAGVLIEGRVETLVELDVARRRRALPHLLDQGLERLRPVGLEAGGGLGGGKRLQRGADLVVLAQVVDAREEDDGAALRVQPDEPFALQGRQGLADRRGAHAERAGDLDLPQFISGRATTRENLGLEVLGDLAGDGAGSRQRHGPVSYRMCKFSAEEIEV
jgi:hypothetical protein